MARILLAEDDVALRAMVERILEDEGHTVFTAQDGQEAIVLAQRYLPDIILMDINMPNVNGMTASAVLKTHVRTTRIPIIAMSGGAHLRCHADRLAVDALLAKPFNVDELLAQIALLTRATGSVGLVSPPDGLNDDLRWIVEN